MKISADFFISVIHQLNQGEEKTTTIDSIKFDQFCPISMQKFKKFTKPGKNISVDEGMIGFKGRLSFRQYMPAKPTKYGIKVWMAADASNGFVINHEVYLGKQRGRVLANGLGYSVVMELMNPFLNKNHHVNFDNFFSSPKLLEDLQNEGIYACSTVRAGRVGLPPSSRRKLKREGEMICEQKGNLVYTKWHDKRDVNILPTNFDPLEPKTVKERRKKMEMWCLLRNQHV